MPITSFLVKALDVPALHLPMGRLCFELSPGVCLEVATRRGLMGQCRCLRACFCLAVLTRRHCPRGPLQGNPQMGPILRTSAFAWSI